MFCFFLFKQKTAYEMRISDLNSDVCSSDLPELVQREIPWVGGHDTRRRVVTSDDDMINLSPQQQPFLLWERDWFGLILAKHPVDCAGGGQDLDFIGLGVACLKLAFGVDGIGPVDSLQHHPDRR